MEDKVQTIDRAFLILEILSDYEFLALKDITKIAGLNKTTTFRILQSLISNGYIKKFKNNKYGLSFKTFKIGNKIAQNISFMPIAKRTIAKLANEINQIIHLVIIDNNEILYLDKYTPDDMGKHMRYSKIGKTAPVYCTAAGKAILAYYSEEEIEKIWDKINVVKFTSRTIINYDTLINDLRRIKDKGYATEYEEYELGLFCIGSAFFNRGGEVAGAISISIPLEEQGNKTYFVKRLMECSQLITYELQKTNKN